MSQSAEAAILERVLAPQSNGLNPELARHVLTLGFPEQDHERMEELAAKGQAGTMTPDEQRELACYVYLGHILAFLKSKARLSLRGSSDSE